MSTPESQLKTTAASDGSHGSADLRAALVKCVEALEGIKGGNHPGNNWPYDNVVRWLAHALPQAKEILERHPPNDKAEPQRPR